MVATSTTRTAWKTVPRSRERKNKCLAYRPPAAHASASRLRVHARVSVWRCTILQSRALPLRALLSPIRLKMPERPLSESQRAVVAALVCDSDLMDMVELWANQRDDTCQRLNAAAVVAVDVARRVLVVESTWHVWESNEVVDVYFTHRATAERRVSLPFPPTSAGDAALLAALERASDTAALERLLLEMVALVQQSRADTGLL